MRSCVSRTVGITAIPTHRSSDLRIVFKAILTDAIETFVLGACEGVFESSPRPPVGCRRQCSRGSALGLVLSQPFSVQPNSRLREVTNQGFIAGRVADIMHMHRRPTSASLASTRRLTAEQWA
ncbi:putative glycine-rich protein 2-like [Scophthalmus maximus]|uniref:Putative glycine-rich protein 2-like n=1 Tax=Scophthalmus maximus TaxID=52904 RepID=A0A2U9B1P4_SCOMX|nr:putative glycine-rich protein 2-like [Scophthalmus maximus]